MRLPSAFAAIDAHRTASSSSSVSITQNPPTWDAASTNGPSKTVVPPADRDRHVPRESLQPADPARKRPGRWIIASLCAVRRGSMRRDHREVVEHVARRKAEKNLRGRSPARRRFSPRSAMGFAPSGSSGLPRRSAPHRRRGIRACGRTPALADWGRRPTAPPTRRGG